MENWKLSRYDQELTYLSSLLSCYKHRNDVRKLNGLPIVIRKELMMTDLRVLNRRLALVEKMLQIADLINEDDAATWMGVSKKTIQNRISDGRLDGTYVYSRCGKRMFFKSKLVII